MSVRTSTAVRHLDAATSHAPARTGGAHAAPTSTAASEVEDRPVMPESDSGTYADRNQTTLDAPVDDSSTSRHTYAAPTPVVDGADSPSADGRVTWDDFRALGMSESDVQSLRTAAIDSGVTPAQLAQFYDEYVAYLADPSSAPSADTAATDSATTDTSNVSGAGDQPVEFAAIAPEFQALLESAGMSKAGVDAVLTQLADSNLTLTQAQEAYAYFSTPDGVAALKQIDQQVNAGATTAEQSALISKVMRGALLAGGVGVAGLGARSALTKFIAYRAQHGSEQARSLLERMPGKPAELARQTLNIGEKSTAVARQRALVSMRNTALVRESKAAEAGTLSKSALDDVASGLRKRSLDEVIAYEAGQAGIKTVGRPAEDVMRDLAKHAGVKVGTNDTLEAMAIKYGEKHGVVVSAEAAIKADAAKGAYSELTAIKKSTSMLTQPVTRFRAAVNAARVGPSTLAMGDATNMLQRVPKGKAAFMAELAEHGGARAIGSDVANSLKGKGGLIGVGLGVAIAAPGIIDSYQKEGGFGHETSAKTGEAVGESVGGWGGWIAGAELGGEAGAAIGTLICPGIGTVIGGGIGAIAGGLAGSTIGAKVLGPVGEAVGGAVHDAVAGIGHLFGF